MLGTDYVSFSFLFFTIPLGFFSSLLQLLQLLIKTYFSFYSAFHAASTDPVYAQNMMFFSINASRRKEMEEVLEELAVTFVPMVAFWDGSNWERVTLRGQNDILAVLASHRQ